MTSSVAVVVCTASAERETLLRDCVQSLIAGTRVPDEILVVVDQDPALLTQLARWMPPPARLLSTRRAGNAEAANVGIPEARNVGLRAATSDVVAFIDDDATAEPGWLASLAEPFEASDWLVGAGGAVVPVWASDRRWLPDELLWLIGCTYGGHREDPGPIRNPIGCNMAFRRQELLAVGGFAPDFGKRGAALVTCDETEVALRLERAHGQGRISYVPTARVHHFIPAARLGWRQLVRRCVSEGLSKGRLHRLYRGAALNAERRYVRRALLQAVPALLVGGVLRRDRRSLLGGTAIVVSVLVTAVAFVAGAVTAGRAEAGPRRARGARRLHGWGR
jgi:glycosyltransferase involved in cell wall biosynthesis